MCPNVSYRTRFFFIADCLFFAMTRCGECWIPCNSICNVTLMVTRNSHSSPSQHFLAIADSPNSRPASFPSKHFDHHLLLLARHSIVESYDSVAINCYISDKR